MLDGVLKKYLLFIILKLQYVIDTVLFEDTVPVVEVVTQRSYIKKVFWIISQNSKCRSQPKTLLKKRL